jgi:hypothetical protein
MASMAAAGSAPAADASARTRAIAAPARGVATLPAKPSLADICPDCGNASLRFIEGCREVRDLRLLEVLVRK